MKIGEAITWGQRKVGIQLRNAVYYTGNSALKASRKGASIKTQTVVAQALSQLPMRQVTDNQKLGLHEDTALGKFGKGFFNCQHQGFIGLYVERCCHMASNSVKAQGIISLQE